MQHHSLPSYYLNVVIWHYMVILGSLSMVVNIIFNFGIEAKVVAKEFCVTIDCI